MENRKDNYKSIADLVNKDSPTDPPEEDSDNAQPLDRRTYAQIVDKITLVDDEVVVGRININTVSQAVLKILLDGNRQKAAAIINYRNALAGGFNSIADLLHVNSITMGDFKKIVDHIKTRSNVFMINTYVKLKHTGGQNRAEVVVDRNQVSPVILYWLQGASS